MNKNNKNIDILLPQNQLSLYEYDSYFKTFIDLYKTNKLPKVSLISGPKGSGKSTFIYHFINFLLSMNEENKYLINEKKINLNNKSFKHVSANIHPNFISIKKANDQQYIKIDESRKLIAFLNKSTFLDNKKIVMIDEAESLNINSVNAILKTLEEPTLNTFFFIIYNNQCSIPATIKSRSIEFKIFFNHSQKKTIFSNLMKHYDKFYNIDNVLSYLIYDTPGNLLKYYSYIQPEHIENNSYNLTIISFFINKYLKEKNYDNLFFVSFFIERYYNYLILNNPRNQSKLFFNKIEILKRIDLLKKFNLDVKNTFFYIENILKNETR